MIPTQNIIFIYVMYRITRTMLEVAFEKAEKPSGNMSRRKLK